MQWREQCHGVIRVQHDQRPALKRRLGVAAEFVHPGRHRQKLQQIDGREWFLWSRRYLEPCERIRLLQSGWRNPLCRSRFIQLGRLCALDLAFEFRPSRSNAEFKLHPDGCRLLVRSQQPARRLFHRGLCKTVTLLYPGLKDDRIRFTLRPLLQPGSE